MNARILTFPARPAYSSPVAGKQPAAGIGVLEEAAMSRDSVLHSGFFAPMVCPQWQAGREEPQGSPVLPRYANSRFGLPPSIGVESGGDKTANGKHIMTTIALGASAPTIFNFRSTEVRTLVLDGEVWFVASDVAKALNYRNADDMTRMLDEDERGTHIVRTVTTNQHGTTSEQDNTVIIINESGLYHAVLKSRKPEARPFRKWVTSEVLPAIRKTGAYSATAGDMVSKAHALRCFAMTSALTGPAQTAVMNQLLDHNEHDVQYGRFLVTFCGETPFVKAVPNDAAVMTQAQFLRALTEGNAVPVSTQDLAQFIEAATKRLAQRCAYYESKTERRAA